MITSQKGEGGVADNTIRGMDGDVLLCSTKLMVYLI